MRWILKLLLALCFLFVSLSIFYYNPQDLLYIELREVQNISHPLGFFGAGTAAFLFFLFGRITYFLPFPLLFFFFSKKLSKPYHRLLGLYLLLGSLSFLTVSVTDRMDSLGSGFLAGVLYDLAERLLGTVLGTSILLILILTTAFLLLLGISPRSLRQNSWVLVFSLNTKASQRTFHEKNQAKNQKGFKKNSKLLIPFILLEFLKNFFSKNLFKTKSKQRNYPSTTTRTSLIQTNETQNKKLFSFQEKRRENQKKFVFLSNSDRHYSRSLRTEQKSVSMPSVPLGVIYGSISSVSSNERVSLSTQSIHPPIIEDIKRNLERIEKIENLDFHYPVHVSNKREMREIVEIIEGKMEGIVENAIVEDTKELEETEKKIEKDIQNGVPKNLPNPLLETKSIPLLSWQALSYYPNDPIPKNPNDNHDQLVVKEQKGIREEVPKEILRKQTVIELPDYSNQASENELSKQDFKKHHQETIEILLSKEDDSKVDHSENDSLSLERTYPETQKKIEEKKQKKEQEEIPKEILKKQPVIELPDYSNQASENEFSKQDFKKQYQETIKILLSKEDDSKVDHSESDSLSLEGMYPEAQKNIEEKEEIPKEILRKQTFIELPDYSNQNSENELSKQDFKKQHQEAIKILLSKEDDSKLDHSESDSLSLEGTYPETQKKIEETEEEKEQAKEILQTKSQLENTLKEFSIDAKVSEVFQGPVVTRYEVLPARGVRLSRIVSLQDNIALDLAASKIRIVAPIPGKSAVGIEVPNRKRKKVTLAQLLQSPEFQNSKDILPIALGQDTSGKTIVRDLVSMPHLLIAGRTGAGKSVFVNTLLCSLLHSKTPDEMRLLAIDPKRVELKAYDAIPYLLCPVLTEPKRALLSLKWLVVQMEERYKKLEQYSCRDIQSFNQKREEFLQKGWTFDPKMEYWVVLMDEFADLMMVCGKEAEEQLSRLAAMSRAVGIHLVLATQRPSVDVITGLIKANFPARIAFQVSSKMESRIILDTNGADKLLGQGDFLFSSPGSDGPIRLQGAFLGEEELLRFTSKLREIQDPQYIEELQEIHRENEENSDLSGEEPLFREAVELILAERKASASYLQRKMRIGYNRAARLIELLEEEGMISSASGSKPREVLIHSYSNSLE